MSDNVKPKTPGEWAGHVRGLLGCYADRGIRSAADLVDVAVTSTYDPVTKRITSSVPMQRMGLQSLLHELEAYPKRLGPFRLTHDPEPGEPTPPAGFETPSSIRALLRHRVLELEVVLGVVSPEDAEEARRRIDAGVAALERSLPPRRRC